MSVKSFRPSRQRGFVLLVALIALIAITLAALALMRSVDTGLFIAGNLAFKQTTLQAADAGTEQAVAWLVAHQNELMNDVPAAGYYASWRDGCDMTGSTPSTDDDVNWLAGGKPAANCGMVAVAVDSANLPAGYSASYVINRMCSAEGLPNDTSVFCAFFKTDSGSGSSDSKKNSESDESDSSDSTKKEAVYNDDDLPPQGKNQQYYYRITIRADGPRNTSSLVETVVAL